MSHQENPHTHWLLTFTAVIQIPMSTPDHYVSWLKEGFCIDS